MNNSILFFGSALIAFTSLSVSAHNTSALENQVLASILYDEGTPLVAAVSKGDIETVKKFIEYGVNVNERADDMSPLMIAARYNKVEIIKVLLAAGARPSDKNEQGFTALKFAELSNAAEAIVLLKGLK